MLIARIVALISALLASVSIADAAPTGRSVAQPVNPTVTISATPVSPPLPGGFVGLAFTYSALPEWVSASGPVDPVLLHLIHNLAPSGRPSLRIGGESADRSWWPIRGMHKSPGLTYDLTNEWTEIAHRLAHASKAKLMLGLNLQADQPRIDKVEARQLLARVGRHYIQSFQIGNEPELYKAIPWYKVVRGRPVVWYSKIGRSVYARPRSYGSPQFDAEVARILKVIPRYPIAGPETNIPSWTQSFERFVRPGGPVSTLTTHAYGVNNCVKDPKSLIYPNVPNVLRLRASRNLLRGMAPYISLIHRRHGSDRIDEMGAVTCTGPAGVSNSLATGLWAIDALFDAARQGVDGVNLHSDYTRINNLFTLRRYGGVYRATVQPIYYGAMMFSRADPAGSRLLDVADGTSSTVRVWASRRGSTTRIMVINDGLSHAKRVTIRLASSLRAPTATVQRLRASGTRGAYATRGITLGGRSFGQTTTGVLGVPRLSTIHASGGGFTVSVGKGSAALLVVDRR